VDERARGKRREYSAMRSTSGAAMAFFRIGCILGFLAVVIGAFGAHAASDILSAHNMTHAYETGVQYQFYHVPPQFVFAGLLTQCESLSNASARYIVTAGVLFSAGTLLFSGSLYLLALTGITMLGIITPFGGAFLIAGWAVLMWHGPRLLVARGTSSASTRLVQ